MKFTGKTFRALLAKTSSFWLLALLALILGATQTQAQPFAYVANYFSNDVSVIDTASNIVVATVPVGIGPQGVAITPNGDFAYVANDFSGVSVIDTTSNTVVATVPAGSGSYGIAFTPNGAFAYVTNLHDDSISVIDTTSQTVVASISVDLYPLGIAITPDGGFSYVTHGRASSVSVINIGSQHGCRQYTGGFLSAGRGHHTERSLCICG